MIESPLDIDEESEKKEILRRYRKLLRHAKPFLKGDDAKEIRKAFNTAVDAHKHMRRKSGEPYIYHPIDVATICVAEIGLGPTSIISALLHDIVEDTEWTLKDINDHFGPKIARIIDGLTKISGVPGESISEQAENFRKMLLTLSKDTRVILIKLADRLHNMRTLASMPRHKQLKIASETFYLYAPLAHRLGLYAIKTELEDLSMKYRETDQYRMIARKIKETRDDRNRFIRGFIKPIMKAVNDQGYTVEIKGRPKSIYSISNKMKKQGIPFEEVFDLFAIRIIIDTDLDKEKASCWHIYSIVTDFYKPNPDRLRDWISIPKANGYESLHTTVMTNTGKWVEVQIRTKRMDDIAEKGYAAHWKYKGGSKDDESALDQWISKVRESLEQNDISAIEFVDDFRSNLFNEEVYAFTPKGKLITLPNGATALDFAFDIHTEVGATCLGAKINKKLVPLNTKIKNGDQVEILTSAKQKPNEGWLKFVVSSKAISGIKDYLKEEKKEAASDGKEVVIRKLKQIKLEMNSDTINRLVSYFGASTPLDFFYEVGTGKIDPKEIKRISEVKPSEPIRRAKKKYNTAEEIVAAAREAKNANKDLLLIGDDMDLVDYKYANCCKPIPGDDVFGFVTVSDGIKIHRTTCSNATELMSNYGYRIIKAKWTSKQQIAFLAGVRIVGTDRMGMIKDVSGVISNDLEVNMRSFAIETDNGIFQGTIQLYVDDTGHLDELIGRLLTIDGVESVNRYDIVDN